MSSFPRSSIRVQLGTWLAEGVEPPVGTPPVTPADPRPGRAGTGRKRRRRKKEPEQEPPPPSDPEEPKGRRIDIQARPPRVSL